MYYNAYVKSTLLTGPEESDVLFYVGFACVGGVIVIVLVTTIIYYCATIIIRFVLKSRKDREE